MDISQIAEGLESIKDCVETDYSKVERMYSIASNTCFLDSCFISHCSINEKTSEVAVLALKDCFTSEESIFVISSLVLYELQGEPNVPIDDKYKVFFKKMQQNSMQIVFIKEEDIIRLVDSVIDLSVTNRNAIFADIYQNLIECLTKVSKVLDRSVYKDYIYKDLSIPDDDDFVEGYFIYCRDKKQNEDSLAENLLAHVMLYQLKTLNFDERKVILLTDDVSAVGSFALTELRVYLYNGMFSSINSITLLSHHCNVKSLYNDFHEFETHICTIQQNYRALACLSDKYDSICYKQISAHDLAQKIWDGHKIVYPSYNTREH